MANPDKGNLRYVGFYVDKDVLNRFDRMYPRLRTEILSNLMEYAASHKDFVFQYGLKSE